MDPMGSLGQELMFNAAVYSAAATLLGVIVAFILLYLILERKKKALIVVFIAFLGGMGWFYYSMQHKPVVPAPIVAQPMHPPIPIPRPFPPAKKGAKLKVRPLPKRACW